MDTVSRKGRFNGALGALNKTRFKYKEREYLSANLALLLKAGVPIGQALDSLSETSTSKAMKHALAEMKTSIEVGSNIADALQKSGLASSQTLVLVRLGEKSGNLVNNLELAAMQEQKRHMFAARVRSALIYPSFVISLTTIVGLSVAWFLLPRLAETFENLRVELPFISKVTIAFGTFLKEYGYIALPLFIVALGIVGYVLFVAPRTRHLGMSILFASPGIGRLMREVEVAQFGHLLGTLLHAGLPVTQAVELMASSTTTPQYRQFYHYLVKSLADGYGFKQCLTSYPHSARLLPPAVQQMIVSAEASGSLPDVLLTIGKTYEQKSEVTTQNLQSILEPILLVVVWIGVMIVAVAVIVPIYSLVGGLRE